MAEPVSLRDSIYLDADRVRSLAAQLDVPSSAADAGDHVTHERLLREVENLLAARTGGDGLLHIDADFDFDRWKPDAFSDGQFVRVTGTVRIMDFAWMSAALGGLPAVLRKMSKLEMEALRNSDEGRRMSKSQLQQRSQENQVAISKVEEFKAGELSDVVRGLYADLVRVKVRPSPAEPRAVLVASAYARHFHDTPAALSQKHGLDISAGWTVLGQLNMPNPPSPAHPIPTGNQMEDAFEQIALLMNNAFKLANSPAFPALSMTPLAIYRTVR